MNEVEKMYRNSGIEECNRLLKPCPFGNECDDCEHHWYPEFTAEKQLELIKWLMCKKQTIQVELRLYENDYCISHITECERNNAVEYIETGRKNTFDEALADLINELWEFLTEEERTQIKNILK